MSRCKRKKRRRAERRSPRQDVVDVFEDFESGEAGNKAADLGFVVKLNWFHAGGGSSLHVIVEDGADDRRLAEWWLGSGKGVLRADLPEWTHFDDATELLDAAAIVRTGRDGAVEPTFSICNGLNN